MATTTATRLVSTYNPLYDPDILHAGSKAIVYHPHGNIGIALYVIGGLLTVPGLLVATYFGSKRRSLEKRLNSRM